MVYQQQQPNLRPPLEAPVFSQPPYYNSQAMQGGQKYYAAGPGGAGQSGVSQGGYFGAQVYHRGV